jgi:hypothetical protein
LLTLRSQHAENVNAAITDHRHTNQQSWYNCSWRNSATPRLHRGVQTMPQHRDKSPRGTVQTPVPIAISTHRHSNKTVVHSIAMGRHVDTSQANRAPIGEEAMFRR